MSLLVNAVGTAAALCSMTSFVPQIVKIWRERDASSVSLRMYAVTVTGFSLWITYGLLIHSWPVAGSNVAPCRLRWPYDQISRFAPARVTNGLSGGTDPSGLIRMIFPNPVDRSCTRPR